ncbi:peroxidase 63-like [Capsicum annuum]|uniref:peroxidase 63-like n=1 Tax=Capsicum annuum TaxID=4072 RepID=UPI001FB0B006|nr:peroxidase 63-like [Capsicum annuum]
MVALSGAHAIGFSYCKEFSSNLYNYNRTSQFDPSYSPRLAQALRNTCVNQQKDPTYPYSRTKVHVEEYIRDQNLFFKAFASAMQKLSEHAVKFDRNGEIRHRCDAFNN